MGGGSLLGSILSNSLAGRSSMAVPNVYDYTQLLEQLMSHSPEDSDVPSQADIQRATSIPTSHDVVEGTCSICQEPCLQEGPTCRRINHCRHLFHRSCIDVWFQTHATCPMCRYDIREG